MEGVDKCPNYVYEPFPPSETNPYHRIRVFHILPATQETDALRLRLKTIKVDPSRGPNAKQYNALSYVWGQPSDDDSAVLIYHEDEEAPRGSLVCRRNLVDALLSLRRWNARVGRTPLTSRPLWADQISINQIDQNERSDQVSQMGVTYYCCSHLHIWLGPDTGTQAAIAFREMRARSHGFWNHENSFPSLTAEQLEALDSEAWSAIAKFHESPWFRRVWVQQELGLAHLGAFHWGDHDATVNSVHEFFKWQEERAGKASEIYSFDPQPAHTTRDSWMNYGMFMVGNWANGGTGRYIRRHISFLSMLVGGARFNVTDKRDYVYAFLGHPSAFSDRAWDNQLVEYPTLDIRKRLLPRPDYENKTVREVYLDTARALMDQHDDLTLLAAVTHTTDTITAVGKDCPSWVPLWDRIGYMFLPGCNGFWINKEGNTWRGSPLVRRVVREEEGSDMALGVNAHLVDRITKKVPPERAKHKGSWRPQARHRRAVFRTESSGLVLGPEIGGEVGDVVAYVYGCYDHVMLRPVVSSRVRGGEERGEEEEEENQYWILGMCMLNRKGGGRFGPKEIETQGYGVSPVWLM